MADIFVFVRTNQENETIEHDDHTMSQSYKHTDLFLTHTWRKDEEQRDNHARVAILNEALSKMGFTTWFDSDKMEGSVREKMREGIEYTDCVIVFVTQEYLKKLDSPNSINKETGEEGN